MLVQKSVASQSPRPAACQNNPSNPWTSSPTLAELAGLPAPRGPQPIDGLSCVPVLRDPAKIIRDPASHCYPRGPFMGRAIRTQRHRLVEWKLPGTDPLETQNLAATQPKIVAQLRAMLARQPETLVKPPVGPAEKR